MAVAIPKWVQRRYALLRKAYGTGEFTFEDACEILGSDGKFVSVLLSELKKYGWIEVKLNPEDSRKRIYKLRPIENIMSEIAEGKDVNKKMGKKER